MTNSSEVRRYTFYGIPYPMAQEKADGQWVRFDDFDRVARGRDEARTAANTAEALASEVSAAIGSDEFLDLPDGGSVSLPEQVRRMRCSLDAARAEVETAKNGEALMRRNAEDWKAACLGHGEKANKLMRELADARAEVARLRGAIEEYRDLIKLLATTKA